MSKQTALQKAIEQLKEIIKNSNYALYALGCEDAIEILNSLLPYEREVIQSAYRSGLSDGNNEPILRMYDDSTDYFIKTFTENAE